MTPNRFADVASHEGGIVIDFRLRHSENALHSILVTDDGIVTDTNPLHSKKAVSPIFVTPNGIVTDVKLLQEQNASAPIPRTGNPFMVAGIVNAPDVFSGTAVFIALPPRTIAPSATSYVHSTPFVVVTHDCRFWAAEAPRRAI